MRLACFCFLLSTIVFPQTSSDNVLVQEQSTLLRVLILPTSEFEVGRIETRFRTILEGRSPDTRILKVNVMDSDTSVTLRYKGVIDGTYTTWRTLYKDYEKGIPPYAELLLIGNNAAMYVRDKQGQVWFKTLQGENPYLLQAASSKVIMLHVSIKPARRPSEIEQRPHVRLSLFFVAEGHFDGSMAPAVSSEVRRFFPTQNITVSIRKDPWFILDSDFPVVWPFLADPDPPSKEQFESAPQWYCISSEERNTCWGPGLQN